MPRGCRELSAQCLHLLAAADLILHAGDLTEAPVLELLRELAPVQAVYGNMDEPALQRTLPQRLEVEVEAVRVGMVHIAGPSRGRADRLAAAFPRCAAVVYGHTHLPEVTLHEDIWILNPGSPTERRRAPYRSLLTLDVDADVLCPRLHSLP